MAYKVVLMEGAEKDLDTILHYLLFDKKSQQAAKSLLAGFTG